MEAARALAEEAAKKEAAARFRKFRMSEVVTKAIDGGGKALDVAECVKVSHRHCATDSSGQVYIYQLDGVKWKKGGKQDLQNIVLNEISKEFSTYAQDLRDRILSDDLDGNHLSTHSVWHIYLCQQNSKFLPISLSHS